MAPEMKKRKMMKGGWHHVACRAFIAACKAFTTTLFINKDRHSLENEKPFKTMQQLESICKCYFSQDLYTLKTSLRRKGLIPHKNTSFSSFNLFELYIINLLFNKLKKVIFYKVCENT
ncbi:hypothetical protein V8G54_020060 [Vigna mungo]|uniref:Uncharacterized protein n=1 Tax=Vigna mungo TaxID=3915 RepID=A0AAQ3RSZ7_VIGMU